jgi:hypothetical protein
MIKIITSGIVQEEVVRNAAKDTASRQEEQSDPEPTKSYDFVNSDPNAIILLPQDLLLCLAIHCSWSLALD